MHEPAAILVKSAICRTAVKSVSRPYPTLFYYPGELHSFYQLCFQRIHILYKPSGLTSKKIHDAKSFPFYEKLKQSCPAFLEDFLHLKQSGVQSDFDTSRQIHWFLAHDETVQLIIVYILFTEMNISFMTGAGLGTLIF